MKALSSRAGARRDNELLADRLVSVGACMDRTPRMHIGVAVGGAELLRQKRPRSRSLFADRRHGTARRSAGTDA